MITLSDHTGQTILILGFGKSGQAAADALKAAGATVLVWDDQEPARALAEAAGYKVTALESVDWKNLKSLVCSPGIFLSHPMIAKARKAKVPVLSDLDFLFRACPKATFIGVTGTNGKSTTTALITHILTNAGRKAQAGGNIGTPALALEPAGKDEFFVLELSSYQLDLLTEHPLSIAVLLNITPDHLDHHGGMDGYIAAKKKIIQPKKKQTVILGTDEPETRALLGEWEQQKNLELFEISTQRDVTQGVRIKDRRLALTNEVREIDLSSTPSLPGLHNAQNAAAAYAACRAAGLSRTEIEKGLQSFPGLVHRQQLIASLRGVRFINDSKATNANATEKALAAYTSIYWIAGGLPKEGGLAGLEPFMKNVVHAFLIGKAEEEFAAWCDGKVSFTRCGTLDKATSKAAQMAVEDGRKNACVLLSPACASFDQFQSFEKRGEAFVALVQSLSVTEGA